ncbi:MAG: ParB/RepB/Spo0J family partition protein [Patescibacteria group bacterium]
MGEALVLESRTQNISFDLVDLDPGQPREDKPHDHIEKLARSIKKRGLLQKPVVKHNLDSPGRFKLVAGECRISALKLLGETSSDFVVTNLQDSYALSLVENLLRRDMNPIEEAKAFRRLHDQEKMTWLEISEETGVSVQTIRNRIALLDEIPPEIQEMVRQGTLPQASALNLAQFRGPHAEKIRLAHELLSGNRPLELEARQVTARGQKTVQDKMPENPVEILRRIMGVGYRAPSVAPLIDAYLALPRQTQTATLGLLSKKAQQGLKDNVASLATSLNNFLDAIAHIAATPVVRQRAQPEPDPEPEPEPKPEPV